jgi:hypothetical protein
MVMVGGTLGYLGLFLLLAASMTLAARGVGRLVGVPRFRWFDAKPASTQGWREASVRLAAMAAPWCLSVLLFFVQLTLFGTGSSRGGTYVEVLEGPAKAAGMRTGDRVLRVGNESVSTWEAVRAAVKRQTDSVEIEIERDGQRQVLQVTPRDGRIAVAVQTVFGRLAAPAALGRAVGLPWQVVSAAAKSYFAMATEQDRPDLGGPVAIVKATGEAGEAAAGGIVWMLAMLAAYLSPLLVGVVAFELVTGVIFRVTYSQTPITASRGFRLARWQQALILTTSAYLLALPLFMLVAAFPPAVLLLLWVMPAYLSAYPLLAIAGNELWPRPVVALCLIVAPIVPGVLLIASIVLLVSTKRALTAEGFRFGWLRSEPPSATA